MAGTNKSFKDLRDYAVQPPPGLFKKLWNKIRHLETGDKHGTGSRLPGIEQNLSSLKSYISEEQQPPAFDYKKISIAIRNQSVIPNIEKKKTFPLFYKVAAAVLIIGLAGMLYFVVFANHKSQYDKSISANLPANNGIYTDSPALTGNDSLNAGAGNSSLHGNAQVAGETSRDNSPGLHTSIPTGNTGEFYNDFIYYLTNFKYETGQKLLDRIMNEKKIIISHFSYVGISDKMASFIKDMFDTNKKGNPSRKAKKTKAQLKKWKKKDEAYFDKSFKKNPLDIIDLTEFLLKK